MQRACEACGAKERPTLQLVICARCAELKLTAPAYYCSTDCERRDEAAHEAVHEMQRVRAAAFDSFLGGSGGLARTAAKLRVDEEGATSEYDENVARAQRRLLDHDYTAAAASAKVRACARGLPRMCASPPHVLSQSRVAQAGIALDPTRGDAHLVLGLAYRMARDVRAAPAFLAALAAHAPRSIGWARAAISAADETTRRQRSAYHPCGKLFCDAGCCSKLPAWLRSPTEMYAMAGVLVEVLPDSAAARGMMADALGGLGKLEAAGVAYMKAARACAACETDYRAQCLGRARRVLAAARAALGD